MAIIPARTKSDKRARRARRIRARITRPRLTIHRTPRHIYAQIITEKDGESRVITSASTLHKDLRDNLSGNKTQRAEQVGKMIAEKALKVGIKEVAYDRRGFRYQGRLMALAKAAREAGLIF